MAAKVRLIPICSTLRGLYNVYRHVAQTCIFQIDPRERDLSDRQIRVRTSCLSLCSHEAKRGPTIEYMVCAKCLLYIDGVRVFE